MTYPEAVKFLYELRLFGAKLGLDNTQKLAALAGNPQERLRFIHVAGTNGKGSVCAMLESIYRTAGLRVGLYTSPHLVSFRERIQVNRQLISETDLARLVKQIRGLLKAFSREHHPTFFEVVTVMALIYFAQQNCELVIWETGMGGRLDATNIVTPLASVITSIALDHQTWLGDSIEQIAREKAGIIKRGIPVVTGAENKTALELIREVAEKQSAPLVLPDPEDSRLSLPLVGEFQRKNATVALATVKCLHDKLPVPDAAIAEGLATVQWPGRMQRIQRDSGGEILLDGAHNPASAAALAAEIQKITRRQATTLIFGVLQDKDWAAMLSVLSPLAKKILFVPVKNARGLPPRKLLDYCAADKVPDAAACGSLSEALSRALRDPFVVITGSLYLVGEAMELLKLVPGTDANERLLNEWAAVR